VRLHLGLKVLSCLLMAAVPAGARHWVESPASVPGCEQLADAELACDVASCGGYGTSADWADEVQVRFRMPHPARGGPWLVEYVAFFMSGSGTHSVVIRDPGSRTSPGGSPPGPILDSGVTFVPAAADWPPDGWTFVRFEVSAPYPGHLMAGENEPFMIGTTLQPGDAIGLSPAFGDADGWGLFQDVWRDDSADERVTPAVRIGVNDLGLSGADISTWSSVKALFRQ
jgi:hypothetical protein